MRVLTRILIAALLLGVSVSPFQQQRLTNAETVSYFGICRSPNSSDVWVANPVNNTIMRFNADGRFISSARIMDSDDKTCPELEFGQVVNVDFDITNNSLFVTDSLKKSVFNIYNAPSYISGDSSKNQLLEPFQTAFCLNMKQGLERIFVIDRAGNKLASFSRPATEVEINGTWVSKPFCRTFSKLEYTIPPNHETVNAVANSENGTFSNPTGVCVDSEGFVYVADTGNDRVQKFSIDGIFEASYDGFSKPVSVFSNDSERLLVLERDAKRISVLNTVSGKVESVISPTGSAGEPIFSNPSCITCDINGDIWVTDAGNESLFKISGLNSEEPGKLLFAVSNILRSKKTPVHEMKVELKKYSCRINGNAVKIRPYAQTKNKIPMLPIGFFARSFLKNTEDYMGVKFKSIYTFDKTGDCCQITIPRINFGDGRVYQQRVVDFTTDSDICLINGTPFKMELKAMNVDNGFFVPFSCLEKAFGVQLKLKPAKTEPKTMNDEFTVYFPSPDFVK